MIIINDYNKLMYVLRKLIFQLRTIEKSPQYFQTLDLNIFPSEMNVIGVIGKTPGINVAELSEKIGITKGAISQIVKKMIEKGLLIKYKEKGNKKETLLKLTSDGEVVSREHQNFHQFIDPEIKELLKNNTEEQNLGIINFLNMISNISDEYIHKNDKHIE